MSVVMRRSMLAAAASASATRMASSSTSVSMRSAAALLSSSSSSFSSSSSRTFATLSDIRASQLTVKRTTNPKPRLPKEQLKFGQCTTDHMLEIDWTAESGWGAPRIVPYAPLQLDPAASCLHYGLEAFEGLKAYVDDADRIRLFRPDKNMARLNGSAHRLLMPTFDGEQFAECIKELVRIEKSWIPRGMGYSLYLRPTIISTYPYLGVQPTRSVKLYVICSPVGPYYPTGFNPVKLFADPVHVRAWPGGTGMAKCGGNYAMGMRPAMEAAAKGYSQVLWLFGDDLQVTEVGTMNQFFFWINESGQRELITAPLDGTILAGVTRDSILHLTRGWGEFAVTERKYTLHEVIKAVKEDRMLEAFGAGTAAIVSPVEAFAFKDVEYKIPLNKVDPKAKAGPLTQRISDTLMGIQYGKIPHEWSVIVPE